MHPDTGKIVVDECDGTGRANIFAIGDVANVS